MSAWIGELGLSLVSPLRRTMLSIRSRFSPLLVPLALDFLQPSMGLALFLDQTMLWSGLGVFPLRIPLAKPPAAIGLSSSFVFPIYLPKR